jgi:polysaccharide export outer membrane protein
MKMLKTLTGSLLFSICLFFTFTLTTTSCKVERVAMLKDISDTTKVTYVPLSQTTPPVIKVDDILNVVIQTLDPQANQILNQGNLPINSGAMSTEGSQQVTVSGYLVGKDGNIRMPYIGSVYVKGLTTLS